MEDISDIIGGTGTWQFLVVFYVFLANVFCAFNYLSSAFILPKVNFWCVSNGTDIWSRNETNGSQCASGCTAWEYDTSVYKSTGIATWNLVCDRSNMVAMPQTLSMAGVMAGALVFGHIADHYGRRPVIFGGALLYLIGGIIPLISTSFWLYVCSRFLQAFSISASYIAVVVLLETVSAKSRFLYVVANGYGFQVGAILLGAFASLISDWKVFHMMMLGHVIATIPFWWIIYESPRWLLVTNQREKAAEVIEAIAVKWNRRDSDMVKQNLPQLLNVYENIEPDTVYSVHDLFRTKKLVLHTTMVWLNGYILGFLYYAVAFTSTTLSTNPYLDFVLLQTAELVSITIAVLTIRFVRRRLSVAVSCLAISSAFVALAATAYAIDYALSFSMTTLIKLGLAVYIQAMLVISGEVYPTSLRGLGHSCFEVVYRVGATTQPYLQYYMVMQSKWVLPAVSGAMAFVAGVLAFFCLPETLNKALEDNIQESKKPIGNSAVKTYT